MAIKKVTLTNLVKYLKKPWTPITLGKVEDYEVKLLKYEGEYFWHKHAKHDEFMLVYQGEISVDLEGNKTIKLNEGEGVLIEKGTVHRSRSDDNANVVVFEKDTIVSDFVKV
jgi:mannose-6-phosphate isomerase-like protein (cupin superfamily)